MPSKWFRSSLKYRHAHMPYKSEFLNIFTHTHTHACTHTHTHTLGQNTVPVLIVWQNAVLNIDESAELLGSISSTAGIAIQTSDLTWQKRHTHRLHEMYTHCSIILYKIGSWYQHKEDEGQAYLPQQNAPYTWVPQWYRKSTWWRVGGWKVTAQMSILVPVPLACQAPRTGPESICRQRTLQCQSFVWNQVSQTVKATSLFRKCFVCVCVCACACERTRVRACVCACMIKWACYVFVSTLGVCVWDKTSIFLCLCKHSGLFQDRAP